jgi:hypothetical protein
MNVKFLALYRYLKGEHTLNNIKHLTYIKDRYPIDLVLTSLGAYPRTCGHQDHAVSDWFKPKRKAASRSRKSHEAAMDPALPRSFMASTV